MKLYRQEAEVGIYQLLLPITAITTHMLRFYPTNYVPCWTLLQNGFCTNLISEEANQRVAEAFSLATKEGTFPEEWLERWKSIDTELTKSSKDIANLDVIAMSSEELWQCYQAHLELDMRMWGISAFIDGLDSGWDQEEIERRREANGLSHEEVQTLLAPCQRSYMLDLDQALITASKNPQAFSLFREQFWWAGTNYTHYEEVSADWIHKKAVDIHMESYVDPTTSQKAILEAHGLKQNPLEIFQTLAIWRDDRKRLNYTGLYGLCRLLTEGLRRQGVDQALFTNLLPHEAKEVFCGKVDENKLAKRRENGVLARITQKEDELDFLEGEEATRAFQELQQYLPSEDVHECKGMIACRGFVKAIARVVPSPQSPAGQAFQNGEILITSMTRPEFLPLMKKAAAIVTDEGGISCHAAIVSRELNIPCIIGTKLATKVFQDGELLEVNAEKGMIRKV